MKVPNHDGLISLLIREGVIIPENSNIPNTSTSVPVGVFTQNIFFKKATQQSIAMAISSELPREVTCICGIGFDGIPLGFAVADYSHKRVVPVQSSNNARLAGFRENTPLKEETVALVTGVIGANDYCKDAIRIIERAGAKVIGVFSVFDYEMRFRYPIQEKIHSLTSISDFTDEKYLGRDYAQRIQNWLAQNKSMLRKQEAELLI